MSYTISLSDTPSPYTRSALIVRLPPFLEMLAPRQWLPDECHSHWRDTRRTAARRAAVRNPTKSEEMNPSRPDAGPELFPDESRWCYDQRGVAVDAEDEFFKILCHKAGRGERTRRWHGLAGAEVPPVPNRNGSMF